MGSQETISLALLAEYHKSLFWAYLRLPHNAKIVDFKYWGLQK